MKQCPHCSTTYTDDTLLYCLADGNPLQHVYPDIEQETVVRPLPAANASGASRALKYVAIAIVGLCILAFGIGIGVWLLWPRHASDLPPANTANAKPTISPAQSPVQRPSSSPEPKPTPSQSAKPTPSNTPTRAENDAGLARITFERGAVSRSMNGTVVAARSYVLRAIAGQYLNATLRSTGGCAVFADGSQETGFTTSAGDNYLRIKNTCDDPADFTLKVAVR